MCCGSKEVEKHCTTALHLSREHWRQPHVSPVVGAVDSVYQFVRSSHVAAHVIQDVDAVWKGCDVWWAQGGWGTQTEQTMRSKCGGVRGQLGNSCRSQLAAHLLFLAPTWISWIKWFKKSFARASNNILCLPTLNSSDMQINSLWHHKGRSHSTPYESFHNFFAFLSPEHADDPASVLTEQERNLSRLLHWKQWRKIYNVIMGRIGNL